MHQEINTTITLNDGRSIPQFGLGVYQSSEGEEIRRAVSKALEIGYRQIDTAAFYRNEHGVGAAVRESGIPREEIYVTTKVWNTDHGYERTLRAFDDSFHKLKLDYIDLYLIHWPVEGLRKDTWRALERL